jgi:uncharacterized SAM-dependent methyltransferase
MDRELQALHLEAFTRRSQLARRPHRDLLHSLRERRSQFRTFSFAEGERVHTEYSYKFDVTGIEALARSAGIRVAETWTDPSRLFAVTYLVAAP